MARVYISIGSNIDREKNVASALRVLRTRFGDLEQSLTYETAAVGFDGESFYNLVVGFDTELSPTELAATLRQIEDDHGRTRTGDKFSSRNLDLDLLLYDDLQIDQPGLRLPRTEILEYAFVLRPLAEIAGELRHPQLGESFASLWAAFDASAQPMWPVDAMPHND